MTDSGVLRATSVNVRYRDVVAVRDVTLEVRPGQLVAVTGPSGAGKTSLLHALAGIVTPAEGAVSCGGQEVRRRADAVEQSIVLIPQGNALAAVLTALENVAMPLLARAALVEGARDAALAALAAVGVDEAADQLIDELSGGQQQRVAVARGIAQQGVALLADEPTSELDSGNRTRVMDVLASEVRLDEGVATWIRDDR